MMSERLEELFATALEIPAHELDGWLEQTCSGDVALQREVKELVAAAHSAPSFLERPAADVEIEGWRAGSWRIGSLIASGGMGDVHRATRDDAELPWQVAIKVLKHGHDGDAFLRRFHDERRSLAALAHPNIVALIDAGSLADGRPFFAMEFIDGELLHHHCDRLQLPLPARLKLFLSVCSAVEHAHRRCVVHCDLKPSNVRVTADGVPKLLDFGIARLLEPEASAATGDLPRRSTLGYASPELMDGRIVGVSSDVFSLGVMLYELCTGKRAFARVDRTPAEIEQAVRAGRLGSISRAEDPPLKPDLAAIIVKATEPDPALRYGSVEQLAMDVRAYLESRPVAARDAGVVDRSLKLVQRNRLASSALLLATLSLAFAIHAGWQNLRAARAEAGLGWGAHAQAVTVARFLEELALDAGRAEPKALHSALDRALVRLDNASSLKPESEGRIRIALGALLIEADREGDALIQLTRARELAATHRGFGREDVARIDELLGQAGGGRVP